MTALAVPTRQAARPRLSGGAAFVASATLVHAGNYAFNVLLGRQLGPALFSELSVIVTFMLVLTFVTSTVQTTAARFVAVSQGDEDRHRLHSWLTHRLRPASVATAVLFVIATPWLTDAFRFSSPLPLLLFAAGVPVYVMQSIHRGVVQGAERFGRLAVSYQAEMWTRLIGGVLFVAIGWSVAGASGALTLSFLASWLVVGRLPRNRAVPTRAVRAEIARFGTRTALLLAGEMVISHSDLIIAKLVLEPALAGSYAAISLIGRIAFFGTWPVVALVFPIVARRHVAGEPTDSLLRWSLALVGGAAGLLAVVAVVMPEQFIGFAFGDDYLAAAPWLWPYVAATGCFALANTLFSYHLARGVSFGAWMAAVGGAAQVVTLVLLHGSIATLVWAQLVLMAALLIAAVVWHTRSGS